MIKFGDDNYTLIKSNGESATPLDWARYSKMSATKSAQTQALQVNNRATEDYLEKLHNAQVSIDAGRPDGITAPIKPLQTVVDDEGNTTSLPFSPPLPDLKLSVVTTPSTHGQIAATSNLPLDKLDIIIQLLMQLLKK